eukprot:182679_1
MSSNNQTSMLGIIGGTSFLKSKYFENFEPIELNTPHGEVKLYKSGNIVFAQRHQADPKIDYRPPHLINFPAIAWGMKELGVQTVIGFCCVGSLKPEHAVGTIMVPDDFFGVFDPISAFEDRRGHMVISFDQSTREKIKGLLEGAKIDFKFSGVYLQTKGPRFETPAEIRFLGQIGDVVGMTGASELTCCFEVGMSYAMITCSDNMANGVGKENLTEKEFHDNVKKNMPKMERILGLVLDPLGKRDGEIIPAA